MILSVLFAVIVLKSTVINYVHYYYLNTYYLYAYSNNYVILHSSVVYPYTSYVQSNDLGGML